MNQKPRMGVSTSQISGKNPDSVNVASKQVILTSPHSVFIIFGRASGQIFEKTEVLDPLGLVTLVKKPNFKP